MFRSSSFLSFQKQQSKTDATKKKNKNKNVTKLDWTTVIAIQSCSLVSIMSSTFIFSTGIFMVKNFDRGKENEDEAKAALRCGLNGNHRRPV